MTEPTLETERLLFRPFREGDLDDLAALYGDAEVMRFLGNGNPRDREQTKERLDRMLGHWREHGFGIWALSDKGGGFVGRCGVAYQHHPDAELAYILARTYWGKGLATEAARAALKYAFEVVGVARVVAFARVENVASRRVLEKVGMSLVGTYAYGGFPAVLYAVDRPSGVPLPC
jgi:RimJ/RimL family protein N-acetyltransferase